MLLVQEAALAAEDRKYAKIFRDLGARYRALRLERGMVQEDSLDYRFSVRHYQQLEAGRPHSLTTLFRLAEMFGVKPADLLDQVALSPKPRRTPKKLR
jgi:transcriptional regulator with XRE-family HTH domain